MNYLAAGALDLNVRDAVAFALEFDLRREAAMLLGDQVLARIGRCGRLVWLDVAGF